MPRRVGYLNIRKHLKHAALIEEGYKKYGMCPAIEEELRKFFFINQNILRRGDEKRAQGNRHDFYLGA